MGHFSAEEFCVFRISDANFLAESSAKLHKPLVRSEFGCG